MKIYNARHQEIIELAKQNGHVDVEGLSSHFGVTPQTIRRDLNELCDHKVLGRVHGGAVFMSSVANFEYDSRRNIAAEAKEKIGAAAAEMIPENASIILNIGTTTEQVAQSLCRHNGLLAITNNLNIANILKDASNAEVMVAGGVVRRPDGGVIGAAAVDFIKQFKVDYAIIGVSAIDEDGTLLDYDYREVSVSQAILNQARTVILVTDVLKFERSAPVKICDFSQIDVLVTDETPPESILTLCKAENVEIVIAE